MGIKQYFSCTLGTWAYLSLQFCGCKHYKMANLHNLGCNSDNPCALIMNLATLIPRRPSCRAARYGFVNNKQMPFLQSFVSHQLLFIFSKHLDTMSIRQIVSLVKQIFAFSGKSCFEIAFFKCEIYFYVFHK